MTQILDLSQVGYSNEESYTDEEAVTIRRLITKHQALADALDDELADLLLKRSKHLDYVQRGKAALAPLKKLPQEIIRNVFLHASWSTIKIPFPFVQEDNEDDWNPREPDAMHRLVPTQVVLAQVCSAWRTIAFSIPSLWNVVSTQYLNDHTLNIASELLSRARGSEITLKGYTRFSSKEFDTLTMPNQFKYLRIQLSYEQMLQFDSLPSEACVSLESLLLDINIYTVATRKPSFILNPDKYPRLKYLRILLLGPLDGSVYLKRSLMPWHQLTTLCLYVIR